MRVVFIISVAPKEQKKVNIRVLENVSTYFKISVLQISVNKGLADKVFF